MQYYFLIMLSIPFLWINFKILKKDLREKKIPNKNLLQLIGLIPFYYIYIFWFFEINIIFFLLQLFLTTLIWFLLYYFSIWSAWDAKYIIVLWLFIPQFWIINFIWNIALVTLFYLLLYFFWFYISKIFKNKKDIKDIFKNIIIDIKEKSKFQKLKNNKSLKNNLINYLIWFFVVFISVRLTRIYFLNGIITKYNILEYREIFFDNIYYIILFLIIFSIFFILLIKFIFWLIIKRIKKIIDINSDLIKKVLLIFLSILIIIFVIIEYNIDKNLLFNNLKIIFTLYLFLYFLTIILKYLYKITFHYAESIVIDIKNLKSWYIVDKQFLANLFWHQYALWYKESDEDEEELKNKILYPNPKKYFLKIHNPLDENTKNELINIYKIVNDYHNTNNYQIKIIKSFDFAKYIFLWFLITYIFDNLIMVFLVKFFIQQIKQVF